VKRQVKSTMLHERMFFYLLQFAGKKVLRENVLDYLNKLGYRLSDRKMRQVKAELITLGYPVGSDTDGYFVIVPDRKDLTEAAAKTFRKQLKTIAYMEMKTRKNAVDFWKQNKIESNMTLFEEVSL